MRSILAALLCLSASWARAQSEEDALNLSSFGYGGTARSNGLANAFGAVGADPVSVSINPAGLALYTINSFSLTTVLELDQVDASYYGTKSAGSQEHVAVNNASLIIGTPSKEGSAWRSATWGITFDRLAGRYWTTDALGDRVPSTILDAFVSEAEGTDYLSLPEVFPFTSGPAWEAYGIDTLPGSTSSYYGFIPPGSETQQRHVITTEGATKRTAFFYSGNYKDRLYVGGSLGIVSQRLERNTAHTEYTLDQALDLQGLTYSEDLTTSGNGFDANLGFIVRFQDRFRAGAAFQSPQWLLLNDAWTTEFSTTFRTADTEGNFSYAATSPDGAFSYRLRTPWRTTISGVYLAGKNGLVSVDYDYSDMRTMHYAQANDAEDAYDFSATNDRIDQRFQTRHGLRIGTEWRLGNWYARGGWGYTSDPYKKGDQSAGQTVYNYAAGFGYRGKHLTLDLAFNASTQRVRFFQYGSAFADATIADRQAYNTFLTLAYRP